MAAYDVAERAPGELTRAQKAAAVLLAVGADNATQVLKHLSETEVEQVTFEIATMRKLSPEALAGVLTEFRMEVEAQRHLVSGGEHLARDLLRRIHGSDADQIVDRLLASVQTAPFHFLRLYEPPEVVQHLRDEHPQTIALVLAHLPTRFASQLLAGLTPDLQADVARRIATLDRTSPEVIAQVEAALQQRLGTVEHRGSTTGRGGIKELATILNQSDRTTERAILGELETSDPELAEEVRALMFVFEDIVTLDDRAVQEVLRHVDVKRLALALKGVAPPVNEIITRNMSERARENLLEEIDLLGAVRIREVEEAQTEIVRQIRLLDEQGTIVIARSGEGEFVE